MHSTGRLLCEAKGVQAVIKQIPASNQAGSYAATDNQLLEPQVFYSWSCPKCSTQWRLPVEYQILIKTQSTDQDCCIRWFNKTIEWQRRALIILETILIGNSEEDSFYG